MQVFHGSVWVNLTQPDVLQVVVWWDYNFSNSKTAFLALLSQTIGEYQAGERWSVISHIYHATGSSKKNVIAFYLIPEWVCSNWIFCCQWDAAEQDEEKDKVGEPGGIDSSMAQHPDPRKSKTWGEREVNIYCLSWYSDQKTPVHIWTEEEEHAKSRQFT